MDATELLSTVEECLTTPATRAALAATMLKSLRCFFYYGFLLENRTPPTIMPFHEEVMEALQEVADGTTPDNLCINMPVGVGKTVLLQYFVAWTFARDPKVGYLYLNGSFNIAVARGLEIKSLCGSEWFFALFGHELDKEQKAKHRFSFLNAPNKAGFKAAGMGTGITGTDAGNALCKVYGGACAIDDPLQSSHRHSAAELEQMRGSYRAAITRIRDNSKCKIIAVFQRLAIHDLYATIKEEIDKGIRPWRVISIPALDPETDKSIWEERIKTSYLHKMRDMVSMQELFAADYQQAPILPAGVVMHREWFARFNRGEDYDCGTSELNRVFITGDTAVSTKTSADYTVFSLWVVSPKGLFFLDSVRGQWSFTESARQLRAFWRRCKVNPDGTPKYYFKCGVAPTQIFVEASLHGTALVDQLITNNDGEFLPVCSIPLSQKDKYTRVQEVAGYMEAGYVHIKDNTAGDQLINEACLFSRDDTHKNDDSVDTMIFAIQEGLANAGLVP